MKAEYVIAFKESAQMLQSRRGILWLLAYSTLLSAFSVLLVSNTELSLLDNAQVLYMMTGTVTGLGALVAAIFGSDAYGGERERGTLVPLLCAPVRREALLTGKALGLLLAWGMMFVIAIPYLWAVGSKGQNLESAIIYLSLFGTPVALGFGYLAMALSSRSSVLASLLSMATFLMFSASPLLIGPGLRNTTIGSVFDAVNPFAAALNTFDGVIIDSEPFFKQTARFLLVVAWLAFSLLAARRFTGNPKFR
jgi:ABC-type transport system involved in multi-copper enzyme maturation permease subunit